MLATVDRMNENMVSLELDLDESTLKVLNISNIISVRREEFCHPIQVGDVLDVRIWRIQNDDFEVIQSQRRPDIKEKRLKELSNLRESIRKKKH